MFISGLWTDLNISTVERLNSTADVFEMGILVHYRQIFNMNVVKNNPNKIHHELKIDNLIYSDQFHSCQWH